MSDHEPPHPLSSDRLSPEQQAALSSSGLLSQLTPGTYITAELMDAVMEIAADVTDRGQCGDTIELVPGETTHCTKGAGHEPDDPWHAYGTVQWRTDEPATDDSEGWLVDLQRGNHVPYRHANPQRPKRRHKR